MAVFASLDKDDLRRRHRDMQMIFQNPLSSLDPRMRDAID